MYGAMAGKFSPAGERATLPAGGMPGEAELGADVGGVLEGDEVLDEGEPPDQRTTLAADAGQDLVLVLGQGADAGAPEDAGADVDLGHRRGAMGEAELIGHDV